MNRMEQHRRYQGAWDAMQCDIFMDDAESGTVRVRRNSRAYRRVDEARRSGKDWNASFNRVVAEGIERVKAMSPEEQEACFAPIREETAA